MVKTLRRVAVGALLGAVWFSNAPTWAQLVVTPQSLNATLPQYEVTTQTVVLSNTGSEAMLFCTTFDRPLQRTRGRAHLAHEVTGDNAPCGEYGEIIYQYDEEDFEGDTGGGGWDPSGITMTPEGRLLVAETGGWHRTFEFTLELALLRSFQHPFVAEFDPFPAAWGITHDTKSETLWWMNGERQAQVTRRVMLLEGDLDGVETGRRIEIVPPSEPLADFVAGGLSYDPATDLFYFLGISGDSSNPANWRLWAIDREGEVPDGYPVRPEPYPDGIFNKIEAHGGAEGGPEGVRVEYGAYPPGAPGNDRIVVVDRWGSDQGTELETPVPAELFEGFGAGIRANPLRSRVDPNGVMYMTFVNFDNEGIVGVRPHPLPPSWLVVDSDAGPEAAWDGTLAPGESRTLELTFRAGARAVGDYTASLQVFDAETGEAVEVPLTLTVTPGVDAEEGAAPEGASRLMVYPNPVRNTATVALTLAEASDIRVAVYDVLGREVAVLHAGPMAAGEHTLTFESAGLPAGVYLIRAEGGERRLSERLTLLW